MGFEKLILNLPSPMITQQNYGNLELYVIKRNFNPQSELQREKTDLLTCAPNDDSNQHAHAHSLIRVFVVRMKKLYGLVHPKCGQ